MSYATVNDVQARMLREMSNEELVLCEMLLEDAAVIIDVFAAKAGEEAKKVVSCRMVMRVLGDGSESGIPMGATQGTQSALGYSQTWTYPATGGTGELYLSKLEKQMLRSGNAIGSYSPVQELIPEECIEAMP